MEAELFGIKLREVTDADLELLRHWRNRSDIRQFHFHQSWIAAADQQAWYNRWREEQPEHFYALIEYQGAPYGFTQLKNLFGGDTIEGGNFIAEQQSYPAWATPVTALIIYGLYSQRAERPALRIQIRKDNTQALRYNRQLGFEIVTSFQTPEGVTGYWLAPQVSYFEQRMRRLLPSLQRLSGHSPLLQIRFNETDYQLARPACFTTAAAQPLLPIHLAAV